ncbi:MAG: aminopeptidase P family protein [Alphaproteobacteria bacterium]|nr:aminopeptidase P family protein [Alphaproteobacteria bacterium]
MAAKKIPMLANLPRAYEVMDKHRLDGLVAATQINVYYLTNFWGALMRMRRMFFNYAVLPRDPKKPAALVMTTAETSRLNEMPTWVPNVVSYSHPSHARSRNYDAIVEEPEAGRALSWPVRKSGLSAKEKRWLPMSKKLAARTRATPSYALKQALSEAGLAKARVAYDDPRPIEWMNELGLKLTGVEGTNIFREIRMIKSRDEITLLREAARINEAGVDAAIRTMHKGSTWAELERAYNVAVAKAGGRGIYLTCGGLGLPHDKVIKGEPVMFDALAEYKHYHGDIGRTAIIGKPSAEIVKRNKAMTAGWETAYEMIKPGVTGRAMTEKVLRVIEREGFKGFIIATPHSVGLEHTDHPLPIGLELPGSKGDFVFRENMVINVDLPYHEYGFGGMHLEDMVLVTRDGCEPLTSMKTDLVVLKG